VNADIRGYGALAQEDRQAVSELMFWAMCVKCTDGNYQSETYSRPKFWRVEKLGSGDYLLILGGWEELDLEDLQKIWRWDPQPDGARNIIGMRVLPAPENDPPHSHYMSVSIRYRREEERRRRASVAVDVDEPEMEADIRSRTSVSSKKRSLVGDLVKWVAYGSSAHNE